MQGEGQKMQNETPVSEPNTERGEEGDITSLPLLKRRRFELLWVLDRISFDNKRGQIAAILYTVFIYFFLFGMTYFVYYQQIDLLVRALLLTLAGQLFSLGYVLVHGYKAIQLHKRVYPALINLLQLNPPPNYLALILSSTIFCKNYRERQCLAERMIPMLRQISPDNLHLLSQESHHALKQRLIYTYGVPADQRAPEAFFIAILEVLALIGDTKDLPTLRKVAKRADASAVKQKAQEVVSQIDDLLRQHEQPQFLLRPVFTDSPSELLRAAKPAEQEDSPNALLRPSAK